MIVILLFFSHLVFGLTSPLSYHGPIAGAIQLISTNHNETLETLSQRLQLSPTIIEKANPEIDFHHLAHDELIIVPSQTILPTKRRYGIVVNIAERRLFDFTTPGKVFVYSAGIGREGWDTPKGVFHISSKRHLPTWTVPKSVHIEERAKGNILPKTVPPGPNNPLGEHSFRLSHSSYLIHGTNDSSGIGIPSTSGCVSLFPDDIAQLFQRIPVGTPVQIVDIPVKISRTTKTLWAESHLNLKNGQNHFTKQEIDDIMMRLKKMHGLSAEEMAHVRVVIEENTGIPYPIQLH